MMNKRGLDQYMMLSFPPSWQYNGSYQQSWGYDGALAAKNNREFVSLFYIYICIYVYVCIYIYIYIYSEVTSHSWNLTIVSHPSKMDKCFQDVIDDITSDFQVPNSSIFFGVAI